MDTLRVLIVDDEPGMRMGAARALRDFRIEIPEVQAEFMIETAMAESGEQALEMIEQSMPDILLLDHKLPGMSGLDVLEQIQDKTDRMLTVMITAYASLETAVTAIKRGAYDFLAKPFTPKELKATVRRAAESLIMARQALKLAQEKRQVRFQFISVLAHELKAPLGAIQGYLQIVRDKGAGDNPATYDHMLDRSLIRLEGMRKMIMDLLDLTRIESGQKKREISELNIREIALTAQETFTPDAQARDIKINLQSPDEVVMTGDRGEIEIIFNNLVSNAVKYNRDGGSVNVNITQDDDAITVAVTDTGIGMTKQEAAQLFGDFVRIKNEKTRKILGSGLGLAILKKISALYDGHIRVDSEPDVGSTFTVTLSKHADPDKNERESGPQEQG